MEERQFVISIEVNRRNRGVLMDYIKNQPYITQDDLEILTEWSRSYISKLLAWLERDGMIAWTWGKNSAGKRRRQYIDSALLPPIESTERNDE